MAVLHVSTWSSKLPDAPSHHTLVAVTKTTAHAASIHAPAPSAPCELLLPHRLGRGQIWCNLSAAACAYQAQSSRMPYSKRGEGVPAARCSHLVVLGPIYPSTIALLDSSAPPPRTSTSSSPPRRCRVVPLGAAPFLSAAPDPFPSTAHQSLLPSPFPLVASCRGTRSSHSLPAATPPDSLHDAPSLLVPLRPI